MIHGFHTPLIITINFCFLTHVCVLEHDTGLGVYSSIVQVDSDTYVLAYSGSGLDGLINTFPGSEEGPSIRVVVDLVDYNNECYIGNVGVYGSRAANFTVQNSDLILCLGTRLDTRITGGVPKSFARDAKKISREATGGGK